MNSLSSEPVRFTLVHDPTESYYRGAMFHKEAFLSTLEDGYWPTGSVWHVEMHEERNYYVVVRGEMFNGQKAVQYKGKVSHFRKPLGLRDQ